ncbi:MAG: LamG domain-containing protein [Kofleriaceae bacterium]
MLPILLIAACGESLFDNNIDPGGGNGSGDSGVDSMTTSVECPGTCLANAAADFNGMPGGGNGDKWGYFDDQRNRTWTAMTQKDGGLAGATDGTIIKTCAANPTSAACAALPGALLVSTAGATASGDPAIAYISDAARVISLKVLVHIPAGPDQVVRLYRNSREDVLFNAVATAGTTLDRTLQVDALAGDRFFMALAPEAMGAANIGVHFFVTDTGALFPSKCQVAVPFSAAIGNDVDNLCGTDLTNRDDMDAAIAPALTAGPFTEMGQAADIVPDTYYEFAQPIIKSNDFTIQFWLKFDGLVPSYGAHLFSDIDLDNYGGLGIDIYDLSGLQIEIYTRPDGPAIYEEAPYPSDNGWHFIRASYTNGIAALCLDGGRVAEIAATPELLSSSRRPNLGKNQVWTPQGAFLDGQIDDFRVFSVALPCETAN